MMPNDTHIFDLAQQIADAVNRTGNPKDSAIGMPESDDSENHVHVGEVPMHLRHLHNLLADLFGEVEKLEMAKMEALKRAKLAKQVFFTSLEEHTSIPEGLPVSNIAIGPNWRVVAETYDPDSPDENPMLAMLKEAFEGGEFGIIEVGRRRSA